MVRFGPQLRSPRGGYLVAATSARASSGEFTIGAITPCAPTSRTRLAIAMSPTGTRTTAGLPASDTAPTQSMIEEMS